MANESIIKLFEGKKVRIVWNEQEEKYYFAVADIVQVLTDSADGRKYWSVLKTRLRKEGSELATNCSQLKLPAADGKKRHLLRTRVRPYPSHRERRGKRVAV